MFAVIMAGGSGTRFWPASRTRKPKQFLNIGGKKSMLVETCDRIKPVARDKEMILVLGREHVREARDVLGNREIHLVAEPVGRNTAPCMGLGALYAQYLGCQGAVAFLPADHFIADTSSFAEALRKAGKAAESGGIVTLGIVPTRPETGYGYIKRAGLDPDLKEISAYKVSSFVEKPNLEKAQKYLSSGEYYWNAGIFIAKPETILSEIKEYLPDLYEGLIRLEKVMGKDEFEVAIEDVYQSLEAVSFDYGIMERTKNPVRVLPCDCGWSDVGSWASLYALREQDHDQQLNLAEGETLLIDCKQSFVSSQSGRLVACLGLKNCLVVDTPDALLIAELGKSQEIRKIVEHLKRTRREELL